MASENSMAEDHRNILVVEDDPGIRTQLRWSLDGFEVITAANREDALQQFSRHRPPVVTLDLGLPPDTEGTEEGFATLQAILGQAPDTKVVIVSGAVAQDTTARALAYGAYECFAKPIDITRLNAIIERAYLSFMARRKSPENSDYNK